MVRVFVAVLNFIICGTAAASYMTTYCPNFCECDVFREQNRAVCRGKLLINPSIDLSPLVQHLDLSFNDISYLDDTCFQNFKFLRKLLVSQNSIHTIFLNAFSQLRRVEEIDLSYNRLEYVDDRLIEANRKLHSLNLMGNKFMTLENKPFLRSRSLRSLNLSRCQLSGIGIQVFRALPNLSKLDISANLLITLNAVALQAPRQLEYVDISANKWKTCELSVMKSVELLRQSHIYVQNECNDTKKLGAGEVEPRFERMRLADSQEMIENEQTDENQESLKEAAQVNATDADEEFQATEGAKWRMLDEDEGDDEYEGLLQNTLQIFHKKLLSRNGSDNNCNATSKELCQRLSQCVKRQQSSNYTEDDLFRTFLLGCGFSAVLIMTLVACALCCEKCLSIRRAKMSVETTQHVPILRLRRTPKRHSDDSNRPRVRPQRTTNAVVRANRPDNFFSGLLGQAAPRQYYRTISQNTATLVRRLSQSNLFNHRESRRQGSRSPTESGDHEELSPSAEHVRSIAKPETPPPQYEDITLTKGSINLSV